MPNTFHATRRVEFADTDMAGIMHFAKFFTFMEEVEHEFLRSRGLSVVMHYQGQRLGWPRVAANCEFLKPVFFEETLEIELTLSRMGGKSLTFSADFSREGEVVARGQITTCCCLVGGPEGVKAIELPPEIRQKLEADS
jgi:acyl-CoA thioester hydrolase